MYVDLNVSFASGTNEYVYTQDMQDIVKSLERLFNTRPGTVPFNRNYGSTVWNLLFENQNMETYQIEMLIYQEIQAYEPRIQLSPADITINALDEHSYDIECIFRVPSLNNVNGKITTIITE